MNTDDEFLAAIAADYEDESLRSVYADWLEERGDERHEYIRHRAQLEAAPSESSEWSRFEQLRMSLDRDWFRAVDPGSHRMAAAWARLEKWIEATLPGNEPPLNDGATEEEIEEVEKRVGRPFPEAVREWFRVHDGQEDEMDFDGLVFGFRPLSLAELEEEWRWHEPARNDEWASDGGYSIHPSDAVTPGVQFAGWIPLIQPSSPAYVGVDLIPGPTGHYGQVINFGSDEFNHCVAARRWGQFVNIVADEYEAGQAILNVSDDEDWPSFRIEGHAKLSMSFLTEMVARLHELGRFDGERIHFRKDTMPS